MCRYSSTVERLPRKEDVISSSLVIGFGYGGSVNPNRVQKMGIKYKGILGQETLMIMLNYAKINRLELNQRN